MEIEYIILNHTEPDHSGNLKNLLQIAPNATVVGSGNAIRYLKEMTGEDFKSHQVKDGEILDLELSALEQENKAEIIASPRVTTANQQTAYIEQGSEVPYLESSSSGATSVSFKKAVLSLQVTPQITPDNKVILDLIITQDSIGDVVQTSTGSAISIDTQEIATQVLVENGETLVLGGIYQQRITNSVTKVPILGDIPYLGALFRSTVDQNDKVELLIFVTPRVVMQTKY